MQQKKQMFEIEMCSIDNTNELQNPTQKLSTWIIHDFEVNHNNSCISKSVAEKRLDTLVNMPILAYYHPPSEPDAGDDALGGHEVVLTEDRHGDLTIVTQTLAIGVFTKAYIGTIKDLNGNDKEVVMADAVLWNSRYGDIIDLLTEWCDRGIAIKSSMEVLYNEYTFKDGICHITNYWYEGHAILNSEKRGDHDVILPAYDTSQLVKFQKLVAEAIIKDAESADTVADAIKHIENAKEVSEVNDVVNNTQAETEIMDQEETPEVPATENTESELAENIEVPNEEAEAKEEEEKSEIKDEVESESSEQIEEPTSDPVEEAVNEAEVGAEVEAEQSSEEAPEEAKAEELPIETVDPIEQLNSEIARLKAEYEELLTKYNNATEVVTTLKAELDTLKPIKEQYEKEVYEKHLSEQTEYYAKKFEAVGSKSVFETEEIQELIKLSVGNTEESLKAKVSLNEKLVELVQPVTNVKPPVLKEKASKVGNLIPSSTSFDDRYSE